MGDAQRRYGVMGYADGGYLAQRRRGGKNRRNLTEDGGRMTEVSGRGQRSTERETVL